VRGVPAFTPATRSAFEWHLSAARATVGHWHTQDPVQTQRIALLQTELAGLHARLQALPADTVRPWDALFRWTEANAGIECQEYAVSLLLEPHGPLIDDLCDAMGADEQATVPIDGAMSCHAVRQRIALDYGWTLAIDHAAPEAQARFWYTSAEKLEPRLGSRFEDPGADLEQPLTFARDVATLNDLLAAGADRDVATLLSERPEWRHVVRRVQLAARYPYAEIRDNLLGADLRPIDLLRCKLAMFGATRFDPRSDRWVRITLFQGAPFPGEFATDGLEDTLGLAA
jgi:hypothetical protein